MERVAGQSKAKKLTLNQFKNRLQEYYKNGLLTNYDVDDPRTWKTICFKCNSARNLACPIICC